MISNIRSLLLATSAVTNLVGQRVFCDAIPQSVTTFPLIRLNHAGYDWFETLGGCGGGLRKATIQIDVWSLLPADRQSVVDAVDALLRDYTGAAGSITIKAVNPLDLSLDYEPPQDGSDNGRYWALISLDIFYSA